MDNLKWLERLSERRPVITPQLKRINPGARINLKGSQLNELIKVLEF